MDPIQVVIPVAAAATAFALLRRPLARRRLRAAAAAPAAGAATESWRDAVLGLAGDGAPISVLPEGDTLTVTWQLHGIPWATFLFRQRLRETWAVDLRSGGGSAVHARIRRGKVAWTSPAATWMPRADVAWSAPLRPPLPGPVGDDAPARADESTPRSAELLIETVRHCVVRTGHRFEPVLEFPA